jgi:hypothetical protein
MKREVKEFWTDGHLEGVKYSKECLLFENFDLLGQQLIISNYSSTSETIGGRGLAWTMGQKKNNKKGV